MPHKDRHLLCKYTSVSQKEALVSPAVKKMLFFVFHVYHFVPRKICCASHRRCHGATLCDSLVPTAAVHVAGTVASAKSANEQNWPTMPWSMGDLGVRPGNPRVTSST